MRVFMAGGALRTGQAEVGMVQILDLDARAVGFQNVLCVVASIARQSGVLADEWITGLPMIEFAGRGIPFDDVEVLAKVVGVAACAVFLAVGVLDHASVEPSASRQPLPDFRVATEALEARRAGSENVARSALRWPIQVVVRT